MNLRTTMSSHAARTIRRGGLTRPPAAARRPALYLTMAAAGALMVNVLAGGEPAAEATQLESVSVAEQLGITAESAAVPHEEVVAPLEQLVASRSSREAEQAAAAEAQAAADQAERDRIAAEEAAAKAA
ncbi:UNVERIFIED_ORG: lytic transglycosylase domain-containing protein, partial [Bacillus sp. AZ43]